MIFEAAAALGKEPSILTKQTLAEALRGDRHAIQFYEAPGLLEYFQQGAYVVTS